MNALVRPPEPGDPEAIAANLRSEDIRELQGLLDVPPLSAVRESIRTSDYCRVVEVDGEPAMAFGVRKVGDSHFGLVWLLSTPAIHKVKRRFLRECNSWIEEMFLSGPYRHLWNYADHRNTIHIRWLKWLGATFHGPMLRQHYQKFDMRR